MSPLPWLSGYAVVTQSADGTWALDWDGEIHASLEQAEKEFQASVGAHWRTRLVRLDVLKESAGAPFDA